MASRWRIPYHWLKDQSYPEVDDPDVLAYLEAENAYFDAVMAPHKALVDTIFAEIKARQKPDDANVPVKDGDYFYQWRFEAEGQYRIWSQLAGGGSLAPRRAPRHEAGVILDEPALARGQRTTSGSVRSRSPTTDGSWRTARIPDGCGAIHPAYQGLSTPANCFGEVIENTSGNPVWSADDGSFFYARYVDENWRPYQVRRHVLGTPVEDDAVVYEEHDPGFFVGRLVDVFRAVRGDRIGGSCDRGGVSGSRGLTGE